MDDLRLATLEGLKNQRCLAAIVREHWLMGDCRGEAACLYLQLDEDRWVEITPDTREACWVVSASDAKRAHDVFGDGDSHFPVRDAGEAYKLVGLVIDRAYQKKLGDRIEICIEFSNATDLTLHYNLITHESSLYFIKD